MNEHISIPDVIKTISSYTGILESEMLGSRRFKEIAYARHLAFYLLNVEYGFNTIVIARKFNRDHTTIIFGRERIRLEMQAQYLPAHHDITEIRKLINTLNAQTSHS